jgi:hypothetical protein
MRPTDHDLAPWRSARPDAVAYACGLSRLFPATLILLWISAAIAGCYRPSIKEGGLGCATTGPECPDGYTCHDGRCYSQNPADAGAEHASEAGVDAIDAAASDQGQIDGPSTETDSSDAEACVARQAPAGCSPTAAATCDPVCQTGCCTTEKCTALNSGATGSTAASLGCSKHPWVRGLGEPCDVGNAGTPDRYDNCLPGLICVEGNADAICLQICRGDGDCAGGARCEARPIEPASMFSASVCGLPNTPCTPAGTAVSGCPALRTCYLVSSDKSAGDRTTCDISSGDGGNRSSCVYPFECLPGWTCPTTGPGAGRCQTVCSHGPSAAACPRGLTCQTAGKDYDICL